MGPETKARILVKNIVITYIAERLDNFQMNKKWETIIYFSQ